MSLASLYRKYLRQVRRLPHYYLRHFFQLKASDDFHAIAATPLYKKRLRESKVKRVSKDLRRIELALQGRPEKFNYILDLAYGRRGKLKWELMEPFIAQPESAPQHPIIPGVPESRPPAYSAELVALLTHTVSRAVGKPIDLRHIQFPPTLSPRANPNSEEARLLGPLSKRLEYNTRWRYYTREWKKVYPPLEVAVKRKDGALFTTMAEVLAADAKAGRFQDRGLFGDIENIVGSSLGASPITRRERSSSQVEYVPDKKPRHPSAWLRRRYQALLGRIPVLSYTPHKHFNVYLSPNSHSILARMSAHRRPKVDSVNLAWLEHSDAKFWSRRDQHTKHAG
ncbi:hypothetical protein GYMLUDRAFT_32852 [Collybiopsis luxurians FD-317 M1]|nr:hypothetical protein GYMLUDRAFT_32852 [Collybiopsis luxurians FD-317 M1]